MPSVARVIPQHDAIIDWLLRHPTGTQKECAAHFEVSASWLAILKNSDTFKARMAERQAIVSAGVNLDLRSKLQNLGHLSLDRLADLLRTTHDEKLVLSAAIQILDKINPPQVTGAAGVLVQNNHTYMVDNATLTRARSIMQKKKEEEAALDVDGVVDRVIDSEQSLEAPKEPPLQLPLPKEAE